jgi:hypothetical protein
MIGVSPKLKIPDPGKCDLSLALRLAAEPSEFTSETTFRGSPMLAPTTTILAMTSGMCPNHMALSVCRSTRKSMKFISRAEPPAHSYTLSPTVTFVHDYLTAVTKLSRHHDVKFDCAMSCAFPTPTDWCRRP